MSWLGNGFREEAAALADAYASMYEAAQKSEVIVEDKKPTFLKKEEFETWLDAVLEEGADLSEYTMDEVYEYWENEVLPLQEGYSGAIANSTAKVGKGIADAAMNVAGGAAKAVKGAATNVHNAVAKDISTNKKPKMEELELLGALADAYNMMYEKKKDSDKCGEDTYWDKEEKKCKAKKKKSSTTVVVGRGGYYGGGHHHGGSHGGESGGEGETEGGTDGGGSAGGDAGGE